MYLRCPLLSKVLWLYLYSLANVNINFVEIISFIDLVNGKILAFPTNFKISLLKY